MDYYSELIIPVVIIGLAFMVIAVVVSLICEPAPCKHCGMEVNEFEKSEDGKRLSICPHCGDTDFNR